MHNYVDLTYADNVNMNTPTDEQNYKTSKIPEGMTVEKLQEQRATELQRITGNRPPPI
jgi:hypothetical protein